MKKFIDVVSSRKSVRSFLKKPVSHNLIEKIVALGTQAPTNCNQQLWHVVVIEDEKTKQRLIKEAASNTLLGRTPVVLVITYDGWNYKESIQSASLMVGHILLAAEYFGLGALPINSYGSDPKIKSILKIPSSETICCFVLLGHPDKKARIAAPVKRRAVSEVISYGRFGDKDLIPFTCNPNEWSLDNLRSHQEYYARKTVGGKEMDIMSKWERLLVRKELASLDGSIADIFSYDGSYFNEFPLCKVTTYDLTSETSAYSAKAVARSVPTRKSLFTHNIYSEKNKKLNRKLYDVATIIFKLERIPRHVRVKLFKQISASLKEEGELVIISRVRNPLLMLSFWFMKTIFGKDVRKTGIFAFFGPYEPISTQEVTADLSQAGFNSVDVSDYFPFPVIFERFYQMLLQYIASDGSSYLHRQERSNVITRMMQALLSLQKLVPVGLFGSVVVIRCKID